MVKQGPIPAFLHSLIEYIAGAALIAAPLLLDYDSGAANAASIILGVLVLFLVATTTSTMSLINQVPLSMHIVFDYVIAAVMIASPFLFGFSGESTPTAIFIAAGVVWLLLSIGTRYRKEDDAGARHAQARAARGPGAARGRDARRRGCGQAAPSPPRRSARRGCTRRRTPLPDDSIPEFEPPPRGSGSQQRRAATIAACRPTSTW